MDYQGKILLVIQNELATSLANKLLPFHLIVFNQCNRCMASRCVYADITNNTKWSDNLDHPDSVLARNNNTKNDGKFDQGGVDSP